MASSRTPRPCPQCSNPLRRVRRVNGDMALVGAHDYRRYRCEAEGCGWEGLLLRRDRAEPSAPMPLVVAPPVAEDDDDTPDDGAVDTAPPAATPLRRRWRWVLATAAALGVPAALVLAGGAGFWAERHSLRTVPLGVSHDGRPLAAHHPLQQWVVPVSDTQTAPGGATPVPLALRERCAWGQPGRNPYQGTTEEALRSARLPEEVVQQIAAMRREKRPTDRVEIRTGSIRATRDGRQFNARSFAMTYGRTLCVDARVNFAPGHAEQGDLFEVRDAQGRLHSVMVPDVCGNVSVLGERGQRVGKRQLAQSLAAQGGPQPWLPVALALAAGEGSGALPGEGAAGGDAGGTAPAPEDAASGTQPGGRADRARLGTSSGGVQFAAEVPGSSGTGGSSSGGGAMGGGSSSGSTGAGSADPAASAGDPGTGSSTSGSSSSTAGGSSGASSGGGGGSSGGTGGSTSGNPGGAVVVTTSGGGSSGGTLLRLSQTLGYTEGGSSSGGGGGSSSGGDPGSGDARAVPEPGTLGLVVGALAVLGWRRRRVQVRVQ